MCDYPVAKTTRKGAVRRVDKIAGWTADAWPFSPSAAQSEQLSNMRSVTASLCRGFGAPSAKDLKEAWEFLPVQQQMFTRLASRR